MFKLCNFVVHIDLGGRGTRRTWLDCSVLLDLRGGKHIFWLHVRRTDSSEIGERARAWGLGRTTARRPVRRDAIKRIRY